MKFVFLIFMFLLLPSFVSATVVINEVMYDLDGADNGREWVEIFNAGAVAIDLSGWKFYEQEVNHKLNLVNGSDDFILPANGYAIIADKPEKFLADWSNFSGMIFDSSFSLKNTGESIAIKDNGLNIIDAVDYSSGWGGKGNGNSLQKISGNWTEAAPTPGVKNAVAQDVQPEQSVVAPVIPPDPNEDVSLTQATAAQESQNTSVSENDETAKPLPITPSMELEPPIQPSQETNTQPQPQEQNTAGAIVNNQDQADELNKLKQTIIQLKQEIQELKSARSLEQAEQSNRNKPVVVEKPDTEIQTQTASVITAVGQDNLWSVKEWILLVLGLGILSAGGLVASRRFTID